MVTSQWLGFNKAEGGLADEIREWAMLVYKHPEKLDMHEVILEALEVIEFGWELGQVGMFEVRAAHTFSGRPEIFRAPIPEVTA